MSLLLGVNVDHVATLRQARYALLPDSPNAEPCPVQASLDAIAGGADSITIQVPLNLEMGITEEMIAIALNLRPEFVCLVPETREEVTTEGGLDVVGRRREVGDCIRLMQKAGIRVSLFIDPEEAQVRCAAELGAEMIELHTGCFGNATADTVAAEIERLHRAAHVGHDAGLQVNAGHGINYHNCRLLEAVPHLTEYNIGHSIVSRAMRVGMEQAVREMKALMSHYPAISPQ
jgi:pyridoxine 5-phosphate synthase